MAASPQRRPNDRDAEEGMGTMGFLDHLEELRRRLIRSCVAVGDCADVRGSTPSSPPR
jgi:hypothetical protein